MTYLLAPQRQSCDAWFVAGEGRQPEEESNTMGMSLSHGEVVAALRAGRRVVARRGDGGAHACRVESGAAVGGKDLVCWWDEASTVTHSWRGDWPVVPGWTFAYVGLYTFEAVVASLRAGRRVDARWPDGAASACFMDRSTAAPIVCWYSRSTPLRRYDSAVHRWNGRWPVLEGWTFAESSPCLTEVRARPALTPGAAREAAVERLISAARAYRERDGTVSTMELDELASAADDPSLSLVVAL